MNDVLGHPIGTKGLMKMMVTFINFAKVQNILTYKSCFGQKC